MASKINADEFVDREGEGKPTLPKGVVLSGVTTITTATVADNEIANSTGINVGIITSTHFAGNLTGDVNAGIVTVTSQSVIGSAVTISASGIDIGAGVITATSYAGGGGNLTGIGAAVQSAAPSSANVGDLWYDTDDGRIFVYYNDGNSAQWVDASPNGTPTDLVIEGDLTPATDNSSDLGASNKRWANVYSADLQLSNVGTGGNEVDRSEGSWTIQEGEEDLFLINRRNGKKYKFNLTEVS